MGYTIVIDDEREFDFGRPAEHYKTWQEGQDRIFEIWQSGGHIDYLYLDHDLGPAGDIRPLVNWLKENALYGDKVPVNWVYCHTMNPVGAAWIISSLSRHHNVRRTPLPPLAESYRQSLRGY